MGIEQIQLAKTRRYCPLFSSIGVNWAVKFWTSTPSRNTGSYTPSYVAVGEAGEEKGRFRRSFSFLQALTESQIAGKIKISHGMIATIVVIRDAVLSARIEPDSRKAFQT